MEHAEAQELLELAVAEPGGLDRLMGRGTPESAALAAHLQSCPECGADVEALRRSAATIRAAIRSAPSPDLRDRTLARVASMGRTRPEPVPAADLSPPDGRTPVAWLPSVWTGRLAAAVAAAALFLAIVAWARIDARLSAADAAIDEQRHSVTGLTHTASWLMRVGAAPDSEAIQLAAAGEDSPAGTVLFSVARGEIVMVANGLPELSAGQEYRCWMDDGGGRQAIGKMYVAGAVAYWGGELDGLQGTAGDLAFGVSVVDAASDGLSGPVLIEGSGS